MTIYASISDASRVTGVIRAGGGHIFSSKPEYFQALTLGVNNYVRGFRKNRFAGTSLAYTSAELRFKIAKSRSYLLPGDIGLIGYYDIGRVWQRGESSKKWHDTYGGGIYFVPYNVVMIAATMGISEEDQLFNFSLGTKLTLTF
jgi:outer membrane protein assembly factor BamA